MPQQEQVPPSRFSVNPRGLIALLVVIFVVSSAIFVGSKMIQNNIQENTTQDTTQDTSREPFEPVSNYSLVYGTWVGGLSKVKAFDLQTGKELLLASLPSNVKKVTVLDQDRLLYINETDLRDHGKELAIYSISNKKSTPLVKAAGEYGIDDYVVSPNGQYLSTWEVQVAPDSGILMGGKSRVYSMSLNNPSVKNLLYDETATSTVPIHYPRAILDTGEIFLDTFLPNSGAGWAYGMSVSNFDGTDKKDLENMKNGTYGTQPILSPDGEFLVFGGYNNSKGDGTTLIDGFRRALVSTNTIELLDTQTKVRKKLDNLSDLYTYNGIRWGHEGTSIQYSLIARDQTKNGTYLYNLNTTQSTKFLLNDTNVRVIIAPTLNSAILGTPETSLLSMGNLGITYSTLYNSFLFQNTEQSASPISIPISDILMQFITLTPVSYFPDSLDVTNLKDSTQQVSNKQLQLKTFEVKPSLAPEREGQQNNSYATDSYEGSEPESPSTQAQGCTADNCDTNLTCSNVFTEQCTAQDNLPESCSPSSTEVCAASPLYLYGPLNQKVQVTVHTPIYNAIPSYSGAYNLILLKDGKIRVNGNTYDSISFDYVNALRRISQPQKGSVVAKENISKTITEYANKLGLNQKETGDLMQYALQSINSPYVFVSFFDHETSHAILPITFDPKPDVYRNIVFYFKQLPSHPGFSPELPTFQKIERKGFTAVEISGFVE